MYKIIMMLINLIPIKRIRQDLRLYFKLRFYEQQRFTSIKKLAIWGWWQGNNLGDNWIKKCLAQTFPEAVFVNTEDFDIFKYKFVILGGGGLFDNDVINPWKNVPDKFNFGVLGLGSDFKHKSNSAKSLYKKSKFFFIRDTYSLDCMNISEVNRSYDLTFAYPLQWLEEKDLNLDKLFFVWRDTKVFYSDKRYKNYVSYAKFKDNYNDFKKVIESQFTNIENNDFQTKSSDIEELMDGCGFVISGRFHGLVAAIQKGIPCIAIDIYPKNRILMRDCGLEEYCIKMDEVDKLPYLIEKAKENVSEIRKKLFQYRQTANEQILKDIAVAKKTVAECFKDTTKLKGLHYGSYWMKENDIINVMSDDLSKLCCLKKIDLRLYKKRVSKRVSKHIKLPNGQQNFIDTNAIIKDVKKYKPDFVILNSAGLSLYDEGYEFLKKNNIISVGIELSDPDVFDSNGKLYAHKFDLFYTNSKYSLENQYDKKRVNIKLLPFAASTTHHYPINISKKYDIVVIGHSRPDRERLLEKIKGKYAIGLYGCGWKDSSLGQVNGFEHTKAINSGKIYLSFSNTCAGYQNVKVGLFEAMACRMCIITQYFPEIEDYFRVGDEILCYKNEEELIGLLDYYLSHEEALERIRDNSYKRFLQEHTYEKRWINVLEDINAIRRECFNPIQK